MSRTKPTRGELLQLNYDCADCGQPAGEWCWAKSRWKTSWARFLHAARFYAAYDHGDLPLVD